MITLYAFATSERPEAYVNALCYCVLHKRVSSYKVVVVKEAEADNAQIRPTTLYANIVKLLTDLSDAKYSPGATSPLLELGNASDTAFDAYRMALDVLNSSGDSAPMEIPEAELAEFLAKIIKQRLSILDVTALKNKLLIDVVALSLSFHFSELYTFDFFRRLRFDERDLYHNLTSQDYAFRNLTDGRVVQASMKRIKRWSVDSRFLVFLAVFLLLVGLIVTVFFPESKYYQGFTLASMIASICSFLFLFWKYGRS